MARDWFSRLPGFYPLGGRGLALAEAPPPVVEPEPETSRDVAVFTVFAPTEELDQICSLVAACTDETGDITPEEASIARGLLLDHLVDVDALPTVAYDRGGSVRVNANGELVDVYVVRGTRDALDEFNSAVKTVGGELAAMSAEDLGIATEGFRCFINSLDAAKPADTLEEVTSAGPLKQRAGSPSDFSTWAENKNQGVRLPNLFPTLEAAEGFAPKRVSPSRERYMLRHKYGVREAQMLGCGMSPKGARYLSTRIKDLQRQGVDIIDACETATIEWQLANGWDDEAENVKLRAKAGLTVPRLIALGYTRDEARLIAFTTTKFMMAGVPVWEAAKQGFKLVQAEGEPERGWTFVEVEEEYRKHLYTLFFETLTVEILAAQGGGFPLGTNMAELPSGAHWVAQVAVDLCRETFPGQQRPYRQEEALAQAWTEWSSMQPEARTAVRQEWHLPQEQKRETSPCLNGVGCRLCREGVKINAKWLAKGDEALVFPPAPVQPKAPDLARVAEKFGLPVELLGFFAQMARSPEFLPLGLVPGGD